MGQRGENGIWSRQAPSRESPYVSENFLTIQRELISERAFAVEYEAQFMDSVGQVFKTDDVQACLVKELPHHEPRYSVGVDWGRYKDYTAIAVVGGHQEEASLVALERFNRVTWTETLKRVSAIVEPFPNARILCDGNSVGDMAIEELGKSLPAQLVGSFKFTNASKSGLIDRLAWMIERQLLSMTPHPQLLRELEHFEAKTTDSGNTRLGAKGGYHDDLVVALALAVNQLDKVYRPRIVVGSPRTFSVPK